MPTSRLPARRIPVLLLLLAVTPVMAAPKLYKWVDEDGNVYYSDRVPPEHVRQAREELNEQGVVVERVERARTREEIAAEKAARRAAQAAREAEEEKLRDARKVLATYASEEDIRRAREQQLVALDRSIEAAEAYLAGQRKNLAQLLERAANNERQDQTVSPALRSSIESMQEQIAERQAFIRAKVDEKEEITAFYRKELERFRDVAARYGRRPEAREPPGR